MTIQPFRPMTQAAAISDPVLWNALMSYRGQLLPLAGKNVFAQFEPLDHEPADVPGMLLSLQDGQHLVIALTSFPFDRVFGTEFSIDDLSTLPQGLRDALNEGLVNLLWATLPNHDLGACRVVRAGACRDLIVEVGDAPSWFAVTIAGLFESPVALMLACRADRLIDAISQGRLAPRQVWPAMKTHISVPGFVTLGRIGMTVAQVRALGTGDVVLLGSDRADRVALRAGDRTYAFERTESGWACQGPAASNRELERGTAMDDKTADGLHIALDFDIGRKDVSLAELESWQSGAVVELDLPPNAPGLEVAIRSNGRLIATGDLIRIDDRLAVRLNRLLIGGTEVQA